MTYRDHPDNKPDDKGTVYITVELSNHIYANGFVKHLEVFDAPPTFNFENHGQVCFVANINGGDSRQFGSLMALEMYLDLEEV